MKPLITILLTTCVLTCLYANDSLEIQQLHASNDGLDARLDSLEDKQARCFQPIIMPSSKEEESGWLEDLLPSIAALLVGGLALWGTLRAGRLNIESSNKALQAQIEASKEALTQQIISAKETADKQIASADEAAKLNFRKEVLSVNRQNWINDLREIISEIVALVSHHTELRKLDGKMAAEDVMKLNRLILKAELMVNPAKDKQFIDALLALKTACNEFAQGNKEDPYDEVGELIDLTKQTLKTEWERVKKGE